MTAPERPAPRAETRALFFRRIAVSAAVAALVIALGAVLYIAVEIRGTQLDGTPTGKKLVASADRILDCTDPKGKCAQRNQQATADYLGQIGAGNILAVVCALQVPNGTPLEQALHQVTDCVADQLANARP